jgi:hypothetical protein
MPCVARLADYAVANPSYNSWIASPDSVSATLFAHVEFQLYRTDFGLMRSARSDGTESLRGGLFSISNTDFREIRPTPIRQKDLITAL